MSDSDLTEDQFREMMGLPPAEKPPPPERPPWLDSCNIVGVCPSDDGDGETFVDLDDLDDGDIIGDNTNIRL
jgi:hypothetical protein